MSKKRKAPADSKDSSLQHDDGAQVKKPRPSNSTDPDENDIEKTPIKMAEMSAVIAKGIISPDCVFLTHDGGKVTCSAEFIAQHSSVLREAISSQLATPSAASSSLSSSSSSSSSSSLSTVSSPVNNTSTLQKQKPSSETVEPIRVDDDDIIMANERKSIDSPKAQIEIPMQNLKEYSFDDVKTLVEILHRCSSKGEQTKSLDLLHSKSDATVRTIGTLAFSWAIALVVAICSKRLLRTSRPLIIGTIAELSEEEKTTRLVMVMSNIEALLAWQLPKSEVRRYTNSFLNRYWFETETVARALDTLARLNNNPGLWQRFCHWPADIRNVWLQFSNPKELEDTYTNNLHRQLRSALEPLLFPRPPKTSSSSSSSSSNSSSNSPAGKKAIETGDLKEIRAALVRCGLNWAAKTGPDDTDIFADDQAVCDPAVEEVCDDDQSDREEVVDQFAVDNEFMTEFFQK